MGVLLRRAGVEVAVVHAVARSGRAGVVVARVLVLLRTERIRLVLLVGVVVATGGAHAFDVVMGVHCRCRVKMGLMRLAV